MTSSQRELVITLELTEEEAMYVYAAVARVSPVPNDRFGRGGDDPVYAALGDVLDTSRAYKYAEEMR